MTNDTIDGIRSFGGGSHSCRALLVLVAVLAAGGCAAGPGPGEESGTRGDALDTSNLPESTNIEDRRNEVTLGWDDDGNWYILDKSTGDAYVLPWEPTQSSTGYSPNWGAPQPVEEVPDALWNGPPKANGSGEPVWNATDTKDDGSGSDTGSGDDSGGSDSGGVNDDDTSGGSDYGGGSDDDSGGSDYGGGSDDDSGGGDYDGE